MRARRKTIVAGIETDRLILRPFTLDDLEAARASVAYGFKQVGLQRLIAVAVPENTGSRRIMELCGMQYERGLQLWGLDLAYYALNRSAYQETANLRDDFGRMNPARI